ncbi:MAG TPA: helix-turn-helix domain-containing protein [Nitrospirota bacterium]|nr:helix-turn-helix domain-containing protein [Nitrospirota bacterium]
MQRWKVLVHFTPVVIVYVYLMPLLLLNSRTKAHVWYLLNGHFRDTSAVVDPITITAIIQIAGYLILSLRLLAVHSGNIRQSFSTLKDVSLSWLRTLIIAFVLLLCMYTFFAVFSQYYGIYHKASYLNNLLVTIVIYVMGYRGIRQSEIFTASVSPDAAGDPQQEDRAAAQDEMAAPRRANAGAYDSVKYAKSSLSDNLAETILSRLTQLMEQEKPHLEMGLTLPMLSKMLAVSPNHLSQVINGKLNKSFFDFVNMYRVEETKKALVSPGSGRFSILGIALDAGFNSKSSFYSAFKKHTGMTPSQFKERLVSRDFSAH